MDADDTSITVLKSTAENRNDLDYETRTSIVNLTRFLEEFDWKIEELERRERSEEEMEELKAALELFNSDQHVVKKKLCELRFPFGESGNEIRAKISEVKHSVEKFVRKMKELKFLFDESSNNPCDLDDLEMLEQRLYGLSAPEIGSEDLEKVNETTELEMNKSTLLSEFGTSEELDETMKEFDSSVPDVETGEMKKMDELTTDQSKNRESISTELDLDFLGNIIEPTSSLKDLRNESDTSVDSTKNLLYTNIDSLEKRKDEHVIDIPECYEEELPEWIADGRTSTFESDDRELPEGITGGRTSTVVEGRDQKQHESIIQIDEEGASGSNEPTDPMNISVESGVDTNSTERLAEEMCKLIRKSE